MNLENKITNLREEFLRLWKYRFFKVAILVQIGYIIVSFILFFTIFYTQNDFTVFYNAGNRFIFNIDNLYTQENSDFFFRYFPLSAIFYVPFSIFGFNFGYIVFTVFNFILNIGICVYIYKIIILIKRDDQISEGKIARYLALFLGATPHVNNYVLGQNNLIVIFLMLWAIFLFIKYNTFQWNFYASILLGISICIKPITFLVIPFLIVLNYNIQDKKFTFHLKRSLVRCIGALLFLLPNILIFYYNPELWEGFITNNLGGGNIIEIKHSFSLTKIILNILIVLNAPYNQILILLLFLLIFGIFGFIAFTLANNGRRLILYGLTLGMEIMLLVYFDSWNHHLLILIPLLILILFDLPQDSEIGRLYLKPSLYFFIFFDLIFMGIWFLIKPWFPYNFPSTIFLLISFYGICRVLYENSINKKRI